MAIRPKPTETVTLTLSTKLTSRCTKLARVVYKDEQTGFYTAAHPVEIDSEEITYQIDEQGNRLDIYEHKLMGNISLEPAEIYALWGKIVTLEDGTQVALGDLIADEIDSILEARFYPAPE